MKGKPLKRSFSLDAKDKAILFELDVDSRQSVSKIAKKVHLNKSVVAYRIRRLEESGVIIGYYPVIDLSRLGFFGIRAYIKCTAATTQEEGQIIDALANSPDTWWVGSIDGVYSICAGFYVKDISKFYRFWDSFEERFHHLVSSTVISIYRGAYDMNYAFLSEREPRTWYHLGAKEPVEASSSELRVLGELVKDARTPIAIIAKRAGLSPATVTKALNSLKKKKIVCGYRMRLSLDKLGLAYYKLNTKVRDYAVIPRLKKYALMHPKILYINEVIGYGDFELDIAAESHEEFRQIFEGIKKEFPKAIVEAEYFVYGKVHKIWYPSPTKPQ